MQQLGDTLMNRVRFSGGTLTIKSVCMLGVEMIEILKVVHDKGFVHTGVHDGVFQFGKGEHGQTLFINDLKDCVVYRDSKTKAHVLQPKRCYKAPQSIFESSAVYENR